MDETDNIQGKTRFNIFEQLKEDKIFIQIRLLGKKYQRLTLVTDIKTKNNIPFFVIDYPEGFREAVEGVDVWKLLFAFNGADKLQYRFRTSHGQIFDNEIWLEFPDFIERMQRRKYFRLDAPIGTKIHLKVSSINREMDVINISLGGALGVFKRIKKETRKGPILKMGETLRHIELEFSSEKEYRTVHIKKAVVVRIEKNPLKSLYRYAIKFIGVEKEDTKALTRRIYDLQRKYLKKRIPT